MKMNKYPFNIAWSEEDEEYVVTCPAFPGLSALGETEEEALAEAKIALRLFIKTCEERGIPLPEPHTVEQYSGQLRVRLPKSLHAQAVRMAEADGVSLNTFLVAAVVARVEGKGLADSVIGGMKQMVQEMGQHLTRHTEQHSLKLAASLITGFGGSDVTLPRSGSVLEWGGYHRPRRPDTDLVKMNEGKAPINDLIKSTLYLK